jgi:hypothetical protein
MTPAGVSVIAIKMYPYEEVSTATCSDESSLGQIAKFDCLQKQEYFLRINFIGKAAEEQCPVSAVPVVKLASSLTDAAEATFPNIKIDALGSTRTSTPPSKSGTSVGLIAGIAAAGLAVLAAAAVIAAVTRRRKTTPQAPKKVAESGDFVLGMPNAPMNTTNAARVSTKGDSAFTVYPQHQLLAAMAVQKADAAGDGHAPQHDLADAQRQHAFNKIRREFVPERPTSSNRRPGQKNTLRMNNGRRSNNRNTFNPLHSVGGAQIMNN